MMETHTLSDGWEYRAGDDWQPLTAPEAITPGTWLRRRITLQPMTTCLHYFLRAGGRVGQVEVNGRTVVENGAGGTALDLDITDFVSLGENTLLLYALEPLHDVRLQPVPCDDL